MKLHYCQLSIRFLIQNTNIDDGALWKTSFKEDVHYHVISFRSTMPGCGLKTAP